MVQCQPGQDEGSSRHFSQRADESLDGIALGVEIMVNGPSPSLWLSDIGSSRGSYKTSPLCLSALLVSPAQG